MFFTSSTYIDPVENQEGGAMYISSGDDGAVVEAELGYVPNNPLFGLPFDSPQVSKFICKIGLQREVSKTKKRRIDIRL